MGYGMPELKFHTIKCLKPQDSTVVEQDIKTSDEVYLVVNGKRVWGVKSMSANDIEDLSDIPPIQFSDRIRIDLYDKDVGGGPFSSTDHLGGLDAMDDKAGKGNQIHEFTERGAHYSLIYEVG
jgi:hypothetical protein